MIGSSSYPNVHHPWQDVLPDDIPSDDGCSTEPTWPEWSDLRFMGSDGSLRLTDQEIELQLFLRGGMAIIEDRIFFIFPRGPIRDVWNRHAV